MRTLTFILLAAIGICFITLGFFLSLEAEAGATSIPVPATSHNIDILYNLCKDLNTLKGEG